MSSALLYYKRAVGWPLAPLDSEEMIFRVMNRDGVCLCVMGDGGSFVKQWDYVSVHMFLYVFVFAYVCLVIILTNFVRCVSSQSIF